ncbi:hypothetical protein BT96DRAFT_943817 [Gymnopus androsaceus JB14]|uniref:Uncharacterized protein n=1 Tax=Gymnopus androsaceus JB14 TaxID=1447944 RepID=A0A6A4H6Y5_9AGAR|nr:hypothetical protein BT96DRAFT_943817 [Gymnopus androsaceus JB14]
MALTNLAFSEDGRHLASAGDDKYLRVFDIQRKFSTIWQFKGEIEFTAVAWIGKDLFAGSMNRRALHLSSHFHRGKWYLREELQQPTFGEPESFDEPPLIATGAHFIEDERACIVSYLHHGIWKFYFETGSSMQIRALGEKIGFSMLSEDCSGVAVTNIRTGIDWYKISAKSLKKTSSTFEPQPKESNIPVPVLFIHNGKSLLMAGTRGYCTIFDAKEGRWIQTLKHGAENTWITAIAYVQLPGKRRLIATGDGNLAERTKIRLWIQDSKEDQFVGWSCTRLSLGLKDKAKDLLSVIRTWPHRFDSTVEVSSLNLETSFLPSSPADSIFSATSRATTVSASPLVFASMEGASHPSDSSMGSVPPDSPSTDSFSIVVSLDTFTTSLEDLPMDKSHSSESSSDSSAIDVSVDIFTTSLAEDSTSDSPVSISTTVASSSPATMSKYEQFSSALEALFQ